MRGKKARALRRERGVPKRDKRAEAQEYNAGRAAAAEVFALQVEQAQRYAAEQAGLILP